MCLCQPNEIYFLKCVLTAFQTMDDDFVLFVCWGFTREAVVAAAMKMYRPMDSVKI